MTENIPKRLIDSVFFSTLDLAIWDITKYEQNTEKEYAQLLEECFSSIRAIIPPHTIVIWLTAVIFEAIPLEIDDDNGFAARSSLDTLC